jgi:HNH endonuclease
MTKPQISSQLRRTVTERAKGCCEYCQSQEMFSTQVFSIEHILPVSQSGTTTVDNLALACQGCNNHKYAKTQGRDPVTLKITNLFYPRQQLWRDHFTWSNDYLIIIGLTPTGRATVDTLKLNRQGVVNFRRVLYATGNHPP